MIPIDRGPEPDDLRRARLDRLPQLVRIAKTREPVSKEIDGYQVAGTPLWHAQRYKCCYCERQIPRGFNDVEHYRPKSSADRRPGSADGHGYWWLAFTWSNLLFACPACNRSKKKDRFPLSTGSTALAAKQRPPGREKALLLDPAQDNPVVHIEFVFGELRRRTLPPEDVALGWERRKHWWPRARNGSAHGDATIRVCGLDDVEHVEVYDDHVNREVRSVVRDLEAAIDASAGVPAAFQNALRLLQPGKPFVGLSYDALRALLPDHRLACGGVRWPEPDEVARLATTRPRKRRATQKTATPR